MSPFKRIILLTYLGALFLVIVSCKTQKQDDSVTFKKKSGEFLLKKLKENQIAYEWFGVKASVHYKDEKSSENFSSTIRLRKDSLIWLTVKKMGAEGGRALIRPDSIFIINRMAKEYYARDFGYLKRQFNIDVDFFTLQQLIVGNAVYRASGKAKSGIEGKFYRVSRSSGGQRNTYLLNHLSYFLEKMLIEEEQMQRTIEIEYDSYKPVGEFQISHKRNLTLESPETGRVKVRLNYSKVEIDEAKNTPFSVSPRYRRM